MIINRQNFRRWLQCLANLGKLNERRTCAHKKPKYDKREKLEKQKRATKRNEIQGTNEKENQLLKFVVQEIICLFPPLIRLEPPAQLA